MVAGSVPARVPQLPADLKGDDGFARARRHRQQDSAGEGKASSARSFPVR
jgi:hypothetical protein